MGLPKLHRRGARVGPYVETSRFSARPTGRAKAGLWRRVTGDEGHHWPTYLSEIRRRADPERRAAFRRHEPRSQIGASSQSECRRHRAPPSLSRSRSQSAAVAL